MERPPTVAKCYLDALAGGDFDAVATLFTDGVDVFRGKGDRIAEVWPFSADRPTEDSFWNAP